jgi:hypothetical protein
LILAYLVVHILAFVDHNEVCGLSVFVNWVLLIEHCIAHKGL